METLKIQIDKSGVKSSIFISLFLLLVSFYLLYAAYCDFQGDVEAFSWVVMHFLLWIPIFSVLNFRYIISVWNLKRKFGISDDGWIEIPEKKVEGLEINSRFLILQTVSGVFYLHNSSLEGIGQGTLRLPLKPRHPKLFLLRGLWIFVMSLALISIFSQFIAGIEPFSKYDAKYLLPLKQVEVVEITGNLKHEERFRYYKNLREIPRVFSIENYNTTFELSSFGRLANEFVKDTTGFIISSGTMLRMKIRKEDLAKFEASKRVEATPSVPERIRYYELKIGEELLFRKKGLVDVAKNKN